MSRLIAAGDLKQPTLEKAIWHLKYRHLPALALSLAQFMARAASSEVFADNPLIIPVPLHASRLAERGYNQAELLADHLSTIAAMTMRPDILVRTRPTGSQVKTASRLERIENMRGAFICSRPDAVHDRSVVIIDDVCTTGATLDACAAALLESGAAEVSALVVTRG